MASNQLFNPPNQHDSNFINYPTLYEKQPYQSPKQNYNCDLEITSPQYAPPANINIPPSIEGDHIILLDPKYIIYPHDQYLASRRRYRITEIDDKINHDYFFYKCWIWFCILICLGPIISNVFELILADSNEQKKTLATNIVINILYFTGYYLGLIALKTKSYIKSHIFNGFLVAVILLNVMGLIFLILDASFLTPNHLLLRFIVGSSMIMEIMINMILLTYSYKLDNFLRERKYLEQQLL